MSYMTSLGFIFFICEIRVMMMIPWVIDAYISVSLASMPPYSSNSSMVFLGVSLCPVLVHAIGVEADPTSWLKEYSP